MKNLVLALSLLAVCLLVSCDKSRPGTGTPSAKTASGQTPGSAGQADGTGDLGGGNGIANRVIESWAVDVTQTDEWKTYIQPIDAQLNSFDTNFRRKKKSTLATFAKSLRWYLAPMQLSTLPKAKIGVAFMMDPVQQLALQTENGEVYIAKAGYDASAGRDRAMLILHEIVLAWYRIKYLSFTELCAKDPDNCGSVDPEIKKAFDTALPPEQKRPLGESDYANIRAVTSRLFNDYKSIKSDRDLNRFLHSQGFDKRMSSGDTDAAGVSDKLELSAEDLAQVLNANQLSGHFPTTCSILNSEAPKQNCQMKFSFRRAMNRDQGRAMTAEFTLSSRESQSFNIKYDAHLHLTQTSVIRAGQVLPPYRLFVLPPNPYREPRVGEVVYNTFITTTADKKNPTILSVLIKPLIITRVQTLPENIMFHSFKASAREPNETLAPSIQLGVISSTPITSMIVKQSSNNDLMFIKPKAPWDPRQTREEDAEAAVRALIMPPPTPVPAPEQ